MDKVLLVNYECGNLGCISNALNYLDYQVDTVHISQLCDYDPSESCVILPGVGNYSYAIKKIQSYVDLSSLREWLLSTKKLMCICLGFQLLFKSSLEINTTNEKHLSNNSSVGGLSIFSSDVLPLGSDSTPLLNVGWRRPFQVTSNSPNFNSACFNQISGHSFYHMHSYGLPIDSHSDDLFSYDWYVTSKHIPSDIEFVTAIQLKNIIGLQFHPEKSGEHGLALIKQFFS